MTYEGLAAYWSPLKGDWANLINPKPKCVASRTLTLLSAVEAVRAELDGSV
jgi:hypothetical protein